MHGEANPNPGDPLLAHASTMPLYTRPNPAVTRQPVTVTWQPVAVYQQSVTGHPQPRAQAQPTHPASGKDAYNPDAGYPPLPEHDGTPRTAPPPYTDTPPQQPGFQAPQDYPKPSMGYPHPQGPAPSVYPTAPGPTVVAGPPTVIVQTVVGPESTRTTCRSCNHQISTRIDRKPSTKTHLMALLMCVLGLWCCVCVPYCVDSCLNVEHYCPNCGAFIGTYTN